MKKRSPPFTLIEILLVIVLLGLMLSVVGINVNKAVHEQRFRTEVSAVVDSLRLAESIMLILDNDARVVFTQEEGRIRMHIETTCPLSKNWEKWILAPKYLRTIHIVNFKDNYLGRSTERGTIELKFFSTGYAMSQGILRLATADAVGEKEGLVNFVCLPGYPTTLFSTQNRPDEPACYALAQESFIDHLTALTINEIRQLEAAKKAPEGENAQEELKK